MYASHCEKLAFENKKGESYPYTPQTFFKFDVKEHSKCGEEENVCGVFFCRMLKECASHQSG